MKTLNKVCQFLAIALGLASLVLFFTKFATITLADGQSADFVGAALGFGSKKTIAGTEYDMARSADILFCFWLTVIGFVMSAFSFKSKMLRYFAPAFGFGGGIYMLVVALSNPFKFIDARPLSTIVGVTGIDYGVSVILTAVALLAFAVVAVAYLLIDDYIEVLNSKGAKKTIFKRIIGFFRDYKSEVKKIVWPGIKDVLKNTLIVLVMCLIIGAFIWLLDFGLGKLLEVILGT